MISSYTLLAVSITWAFAAAVVAALQCSPNRWALGPMGSDVCIDQFAAQIGIRAIDIVTDVALAVLPSLMVASVQMTRSKRLIVGSMFAVRLMYVFGITARYITNALVQNSNMHSYFAC